MEIDLYRDPYVYWLTAFCSRLKPPLFQRFHGRSILFGVQAAEHAIIRWNAVGRHTVEIFTVPSTKASFDLGENSGST